MAALAIWAVAIVLAPILRHAEAQRLSTEVAELRTESRDAARMQAGLRILRQPDAAAAARLGRMDALDTLRLLSDVLPRDVQLGALEIADTHIAVSVIGGDARKAAAALERSGRFRKVGLHAPVGRGVFQIELLR